MEDQPPEFSRILSVARLSPNGMEELLEAKPAERTDLAKRFNILDLPSLKADLTVTPGDQETITVSGTIEAKAVQSCVITLEPIETTLKIDVDVIFLPSESSRPHPSDALEDEFEYYTGGKIDLGELVSQQLGVNLDPYPRKNDACLTQTEFGAKIVPLRPLAQLSKVLKSKKNKEKN